MNFYKNHIVMCDHCSNYPTQNTCRHSVSEYGENKYRPCVYGQMYDPNWEVHPCPHFNGYIYKYSGLKNGEYLVFKTFGEGKPLTFIEYKEA